MASNAMIASAQKPHARPNGRRLELSARVRTVCFIAVCISQGVEAGIEWEPLPILRHKSRLEG
jgi:hypothetical protein